MKLEFNEYKQFIDVDKIPHFAKLIFQNSRISDNDKIRFSIIFLSKYLEDEELRDDAEGMKILFLDHKIRGIFHPEDIKNIPDKNYPGYKKLCFIIKKNPETYYLMTCAQLNIFPNFNTFKIKCRTHINNSYIEEERLFDSGSSYTIIPYPKFWDYKNLKYKNENIGDGRYSYNISDLNKNIDSVEDLELSTASVYKNGKASYKKINWKLPLKFSLGDLPYVEVMEMIVPIQYIEDLNVLGIDIICKHTIMLSSSTGIPEIKIFASENMFVNNSIFKKD